MAPAGRGISWIKVLFKVDELMLLAQEPVIREQLHPLKERIDAEVSEALSLVCTEETVQTVKAKRAELSKLLQSLEGQRKAIKNGVLGPYQAFEAIYKECVSDALKSADAALKGKIDAVELEQKQRCESELRDYFAELCVAYHVEWLTFEQTGVKIGLTEAKQKSHKRLKEQLTVFASSVEKDVQAINGMEGAPEILAEYKACLNMGQAVSIVRERHRRIEQERTALVAGQEVRQREAEAVSRVEAVVPPVVLLPPSEAKIYKATFTVRGTMEQLKKLKKFMEEEGIKYE